MKSFLVFFAFICIGALSVRAIASNVLSIDNRLHTTQWIWKHRIGLQGQPVRAVCSKQVPGRTVSPDSLIWVEATHIHADTLYRSQGQYQRKVKFRNDFREAVIVTNATTNDGGSMATGPKKPVPRGQEFEVLFIQDLYAKTGAISRVMTVTISTPAGQVQKLVVITAYIVNDL